MNRKVNGQKGQVFEMNLEEFFNVTKSPEVASLITRIRHTEDKDERRRLKSQLPFRCPHYFRFRDDHRAQDSILSDQFTFQTCVDIDDVEQVEPALSRAYILNNAEGEWKDMLLHVERSASGKLHLDIRIPVGMTIREAQEAYCKALGIDFDEDCCSPERMIYITDADSQLYTSEGWYAHLSDSEIQKRQKAYTDRGLCIDGRSMKSEEWKVESGEFATAKESELKNQPCANEGKIAPVANEGKISLVSDYPTDYNGIPYAYIVEELTDQMGGVPAHGSRNSFIFTMACQLRHICNEDAAWIKQVLPNYGEAQERVNSTIDSACRRSQAQNMSEKLKTAILLARKRVSMEKGVDENSLMRQPELPERLPAPMRLITSKAPRGYWPAIMNTSFAAFATYTGGVKAEYWDGTQRELTQICCLSAPMSSGKSSIKEPIRHILRPIEERDQLARQKERQWAEDTNTRGANKEKPERPKNICVQVVDSDMTNAAFTQRLDDAERCGNKALFTIMDEIEQLRKVCGGISSEVSQIIRRDFDTDKYGQERVSAQSVKARTTMRWNVVFATTPNTAKMYFGSNIDNGTFSRIDLSTIVKEELEHRPKFKSYDEAFDKKLMVFLARLESAKGIISCSQAKKHTEHLLDLAEDRALMMANESYKELSYRAADIAFRKAILLYIMNGMKWSKEIEEFVTWTFEYNLWVKMCLLGEEAAIKLAQDNRVMKPGVPCLLEQLGDSFTKQEFDVLYRSQYNVGNSSNISKAASTLRSKWKSRGWIREDTEQKLFYKTEEYYDKHAA